MLPAGFVKIRHYVLLANRGRTERLARCRALLAAWALVQCVLGMCASAEQGGCGRGDCPSCGSERWGRVLELPREELDTAERSGAGAARPDTS